jgi:hypothetical protein
LAKVLAVAVLLLETAQITVTAAVAVAIVEFLLAQLLIRLMPL